MTKMLKEMVLINLLKQYAEKRQQIDASIDKIKEIGLEPSPETLAARKTYRDMIVAIGTLLDHLDWKVTK